MNAVPRFQDENQPYVFIVGENPVNKSVLIDRTQIPLLPTNKKMRLFPHQFDGGPNSIFTAAQEANVNCLEEQVYLVYKCLDMRPNRIWLKDHNLDRIFWFAIPEGLQIIEVQPVCAADNNVVSRSFPLRPINEPLQYYSFNFVPEPKFARPQSIEELRRNLTLYLLYRTGEERGNIDYLRKIGKFKGYSVDQKKTVAGKLLDSLNKNAEEITLKKEEMKILNNGLLAKASSGYENLMLATKIYAP